MKNCFWFLKQKGFRTLFTGLVIVLLLMSIFIPIVITIIWAFVDPKVGWSYSDMLPSKLSLYFWKWAFEKGQLGKSMLLSFIIAPLTTFLCAALSIPTGYALGRHTFPGRKIADLMVLAPMIIPGMGVAVGLAAIFIKIGLSGTILGVILAHTVILIPYMLRTVTASFKSIPQEIIDAARNYKTNNLQLVWYVFVPLVLPGIIAGSIFTFIYSIEEFSMSFIIGAPSVQTLPVLLYGYLGDYFIRSAASVVSLIILVPTIAVLFITEKVLKSEYISAGFGKG